MVRATLAILMALAAGSANAATSVSIVHGDVVCHYGKGRRVLTTDGKNNAATISPDSHTVAFLHLDLSQNTPVGLAGALWTGDCQTGSLRRILPSVFKGRTDGDMWISLGNPAFSIDGRHLFVSGFYGGDGGLIQRVETATGRHDYAFPGELFGVLRSGPYRGDLLATQHTALKDKDGLEYGGYPLYVFRLDGQVVQRVTGSENWNGKQIEAWLKAKGWTAN